MPQSLLVPSHSLLRLLLVTVVLAVLSAGAWFAWLGWDHQYYLVDGVAQGPYRPWQVVGCAASVAVATVLARLSSRHDTALLLLPLAGTVGFAVPWSADASADVTGMWVVGLFLLLVGGFAGLVVVAALTDAGRHLWTGRRPSAAGGAG